MTRIFLAALVAAFTVGAAVADEMDESTEPTEASDATRAGLESAFASAGFGFLSLPPFLTEEQAATLMSIMEDPALDNGERQKRVTQLIEDAMNS